MFWTNNGRLSKMAAISRVGVSIVAYADATYVEDSVATITECANVTRASLSPQQPEIFSTEGFQTIFVTATVESHEMGDGWDKYADEFQIRDAETGIVLSTRTLMHPHVNEQPFTRSLLGVNVSDSIRCVEVAARDSVLGYCGTEYELCRSNDPESPWLEPDSSGAVMGSYEMFMLMLLVGFFPIVGWNTLDLTVLV